jgi:hypothetical protein
MLHYYGDIEVGIQDHLGWDLGIMRVELFNKKTSPKYRTDVRFWDSREKYRQIF